MGAEPEAAAAGLRALPGFCVGPAGCFLCAESYGEFQHNSGIYVPPSGLPRWIPARSIDVKEKIIRLTVGRLLRVLEHRIRILKNTGLSKYSPNGELCQGSDFQPVVRCSCTPFRKALGSPAIRGQEEALEQAGKSSGVIRR